MSRRLTGLVVPSLVLLLGTGCGDGRADVGATNSGGTETVVAADEPPITQSPPSSSPVSTHADAQASEQTPGAEATAATLSNLSVLDSPTCLPDDQFERFRSVTLSVEQADAAEELTESMSAIAGVRNVVFAQDGTPTVIVDPSAVSLELGYETLTSCVSDEDIAAAKAAAESLHLAENEHLLIGYSPFSDRIWIATNIDESTVWAAMPPHLTERQLAIESLDYP